MPDEVNEQVPDELETATAEEGYEGQPTEVDEDLLATAELKSKPRQPDAHRASIEGVRMETFPSGATAMIFSVKSLDTGLETDKAIFLPQGFVEDIAVQPKDLPAEEGNNQRSSYAINVANTDKSAHLQVLRTIAKSQGRTPTKRASNFEEYVELHNELLTGVMVVFSRRTNPKEPDPEFRNILKIQRFYNPDDVVGNPKRLKGYRKMWEESEGEA